MTTADYLTQLVKDVETVTTNLNAQGVTTESTETLTTLAPKIGSISQDLSTATYMQLFDLFELYNNNRPINEQDYTSNEVDKVDKLINILGGVTNG